MKRDCAGLLHGPGLVFRYIAIGISDDCPKSMGGVVPTLVAL